MACGFITSPQFSLEQATFQDVGLEVKTRNMNVVTFVEVNKQIITIFSRNFSNLNIYAETKIIDVDFLI